MIYWTSDAIKIEYSTKSNEKIYIEMMNDTMLIKKNSMTQRKFWMNFISYIQANRAKISK